MPYVTSEIRRELRSRDAISAGELNYKLTLLVLRYLVINGTSYQTFNDVLGALEGAKHEFYRRVVVPYEESKIEANGDVYD